MASRLHRQSFSLARRYRHIQINRIRCDSIHRPALPPKFPAHNSHVRAIVIRNLRNLSGLYFLIPRRGHLQRRRKIRPQLKSMHSPSLVAFRHLLMNNSAARRHPLHVSRRDCPVVSHAVAMLHSSRQHISNGLNPAVRMPRKTGEIILRNIIAEIVEQKKWIKLFCVSESECSAQMHPRAFQSRLRLNQSLHRSN